MEVSDKLAMDFNTILCSHTLMLLLLISFSAYIYFRAKKSPLLYSYLSVEGIVALWMIAKIFKTLSPRVEMRWFFIIVQYLAIDSLGVCLLVFAYIYRKNKKPSKKQLILWSIPPALSFLVLVSNPLHMTFYSYFDIYRDRFGPAFYVAQSVHYLYLLTGILILSHSFTKQPGFRGKENLGNLFAVFVLLPLLGNVYYIAFKMNLLPWIFSFPVFDFTPIAASISLMLFVIPTLTFRFFDISPISLGRLYDIVPQGLIFVDTNLCLYGGNRTFYSMLHLGKKTVSILQLRQLSSDLDDESTKLLQNLTNNSTLYEVEIQLTDGRIIKVEKHPQKNGHFLLCFYDITEISRNRMLLTQQNKELEEKAGLLRNMADTTRDLAIARTKAQIAQNVHDILGHSLTVLIGTAELAADNDVPEATQKINQIEELLICSLNDLKNALLGKGMKWGETSLIKAIRHLKNENIQVDLQVHGKTYELTGEQTEAIYRLCQEGVTNAIKHGKAKTIYLILRFQPKQIEIFALDNGTGCQNINKNYGLTGIERRIQKLSGTINFTSDGESGFTIRATLPKQARD